MDGRFLRNFVRSQFTFWRLLDAGDLRMVVKCSSRYVGMSFAKIFENGLMDYEIWNAVLIRTEFYIELWVNVDILIFSGL